MKRYLVYLIILSIISSVFCLNVYALEEKFKVAGDNNFPPYEFIDADGIYKGFNVDMLKAISIATGIDFEFIPMDWEDAYYALANGEVDLIQGMKESEERKDKFSFTNSLIMNSQSIFVLNNSWNINGFVDLSGETVALHKEDSAYYEISKINGVKIIQYDSIKEALEALLNGEVSALIGNTLTVNYLCNENNSTDLIKIVGNSLNEKKYCMAVNKNNEELLDKLNYGLKEIQNNGMYDLIYRKWFGTPIRNVSAQNQLLIKVIFFTLVIVFIIEVVILYSNKKLDKIIKSRIEKEKAIINEIYKHDKMQFMDKLISSIAHEIRNPLTSIRIYTRQMKDKVENKEFMLAASEDIPAEIDRIDSLIKEFVEYTSPRKPVREVINLNEEIQNSIKLVKMQIKNIDVEVNIDSSYYAKFDVNHLKQIIFNIILNSIDAVKNIENPLIKIYAKSEGKNVIIYFEDNGYGMNESNIEKIFDPFFTTKDNGNGIGMFVVRQMVEDNGGSITAHSEGEFKGMCITVTVEKGGKFEEQIVNS